MGISNPHYFGWAGSTLSGWLNPTDNALQVLALGETRRTPALEAICNRLGPTTRLELTDIVPVAGHRVIDINALDAIDSASADVLTALRCALFIDDPDRFVREAHRIIRPNGTLLIDWHHGSLRNVTRPTLPLVHTVFVDDDSLRLCAAAFRPFIGHVRRPHWWRPAMEPAVSLATYAQIVRTRNPRCLDAQRVAPWFTVRHQAAVYYYPLTKKYSLLLLTELQRES